MSVAEVKRLWSAISCPCPKSAIGEFLGQLASVFEQRIDDGERHAHRDTLRLPFYGATLYKADALTTMLFSNRLKDTLGCADRVRLNATVSERRS
jgi:hypothetical protein